METKDKYTFEAGNLPPNMRKMKTVPCGDRVYVGYEISIETDQAKVPMGFRRAIHVRLDRCNIHRALAYFWAQDPEKTPDTRELLAALYQSGLITPAIRKLATEDLEYFKRLLVEERNEAASANFKPKLQSSLGVPRDSTILLPIDDNFDQVMYMFSRICNEEVLWPPTSTINIHGLMWSLCVNSIRYAIPNFKDTLNTICQKSYRMVTLADVAELTGIPETQFIVPPVKQDCQMIYLSLLFYTMLDRILGVNSTGVILATWASNMVTTFLVQDWGFTTVSIKTCVTCICGLTPFYSLYPGLAKNMIAFLNKWKTDSGKIGSFFKQVDKRLAWSDLRLCKKTHEFLVYSRSSILLIHLLQREIITFLSVYDTLKLKLGDMFPYAQVLELTEVNDLNQCNFPNLYYTSLVCRNESITTLRKFRRSISGVTLTDQEIRLALLTPLSAGNYPSTPVDFRPPFPGVTMTEEEIRLLLCIPCSDGSQIISSQADMLNYRR